MSTIDNETATITTDTQTPTSGSATPALPKSSGRPLARRIMHIVRRGHLYFGLALIPWVLLYGITGFLLNHPGAFPDQNSATEVPLNRETIRGTPLETLPSPAEDAQKVVDALNAKFKPTTPYKLGAGEVHYSNGTVQVAVVDKDKTKPMMFRYDPKNGSGMLMSPPAPAEPANKPAPFAVGPAKNSQAERNAMIGMVGMMNSMSMLGGSNRLTLKESLPDQVKAAVPTIFERLGYSAGQVNIGQAPDLIFPIEVDGQIWTANYSYLRGTVSGTPAGQSPPSNLSFRRFLIRMHFAHKYPDEFNIKWFWAVIVDVVAFVMCFWSFSGLFMWWQIKATRKAGLVVVAFSTVLAIATAFGMHSFFTM